MFLAADSIKYRPQKQMNKYPAMPVFFDLLDFDYRTNLYATGIQAALHSVNSGCKEFIIGTKFPWLFENSPYATSVVDNRDEVLKKHKYLKHYASNPNEAYQVITGNCHFSFAWVKSYGYRNTRNPLPVCFNEYERSEDRMVSLQDKEVEKELLKRTNYYKVPVAATRKNFIDVLKAKAVICDDSSWAYLINPSSLVIWYQYSYRKYGFDTQLNYYVQNCGTPLCNRPMRGMKDRFKCPYDYECKKQNGLLTLIEGNLNGLQSMCREAEETNKEKENEKPQQDIFNWV